MWRKICAQKPIDRQPDGTLPRLTPKQARSVRRLVKGCCNYADGSCLLLDDGEEQVCPQSISYSLNCGISVTQCCPVTQILKMRFYAPGEAGAVKFAVLISLPVLDVPNTVPTVQPTYIGNRKPPMPENGGRE